MNEAMLRADCTRCAALCCVYFAFDRSDLFAFDKAAGVACPNLDSDHRCSIHADLTDKGFGGCVRFDCSGAGQRVTQELFQGRSWREDPAIAAPMFDAFRAMRVVHELWALLRAAAQLPLTPEQVNTRDGLQDALEPPPGWSLQTLVEFERSDTPARVRTFLATLQDHVLGQDHGSGT